MTRTCTVEGCSRPWIARGWCTMHYRRWSTHGDPHKVQQTLSPLERFHAYYSINEDTGCWEWTGYRRPGRWNYGTLMVNGKSVRAHRWSYEQFMGPIPDGFVIDHLCRNPPCVNPEHLDAVTTRENTIERGMGQRAITYRERRCKRGHDLTEDNVYSPPSNPAIRQCIKCRRIREQQRNRRAAA